MTDFVETIASAMAEGRLDTTRELATKLLSGTPPPTVGASDLTDLKIEVARWLHEKGVARLAADLLLGAIADIRQQRNFDAAHLATLLDEAAAMLTDCQDHANAAEQIGEALTITRELDASDSPARLNRLIACAAAFGRAGQFDMSARLKAEHERFRLEMDAEGAKAARGRRPAAGSPRRIDPLLGDVSDGKIYDIVRVHFGTHRRPRGKSDAYEAFTGERDKLMHFGYADVSVPRGRELGTLQTPRWRTERKADRARYFVIDGWKLFSNTPMSSQDVFVQSLKAETDAAGEKEMLIFIHGYRNSFHSAMIQAAQLSTDLDIDGPTVAYSWPSRDSTLSYFIDRNQVLTKYVEDLRDMIILAATKAGARKVHIIAHSLGSAFLLQGLEALAQIGFGRQPIFQEIVFASPDFDAADFAVRAPRIATLGRRVTVYTSEHDLALKISERLHGSIRAGRAAEEMCVKGLDCVDTSPATISFVGHSDYAETALDDLRAVLWLGARPQRRRLQEVPRTSNSFWRYEPEEAGRPAAKETLAKPYRKALYLIRSLGPDGAKAKVAPLLDPLHSDLEHLQHWHAVNRHIDHLVGR